MTGRSKLTGVLAVLVVVALSACSSSPVADQGPGIKPVSQAPSSGASPSAIAPSLPTPTADSACLHAEPTPAQAEGPYFRPGAPLRQSLLEPGMTGARLVIVGRVLTRECGPAAGARLDFWQTDAQGEYDNAGFRLRGHQFTDDAGQYRLETVVPGEYPGRPPHIHVKVSIPNGPSLTTQLYFPGQVGNTAPGGNAADALFNPLLVLPVAVTAEGRSAHVDFVP